MALVLVIDMQGDQAPWINQTLRKAGHEVILSAELPTGNLAGLLRPAVVVINLDDGCQPNVHPLEILRRNYFSASIIALTHCAEFDTAVTCMRAGAVDCLPVPVEPPQLLNAVEQAITRSRMSGGSYRTLDHGNPFTDERYKLLAEISNEGIWALDERYGTVFINNRMCEMLGYSPEEMLGRRSLEFMPPEEAEKQKQRLATRQDRQLDRYERCFLRKDGTRVYFIVSASPMFDRENKLTGYVATLTDITARKQVENEMVAKEAKFRTVIEQLSEGFLLVDEMGFINEWNPAQERITGVPTAQAIGKNFSSLMFDLMLPEHRTEERLTHLTRIIQDGLKTGQSYFFDHPIEITIQSSDGTQRFLEQTIFPIQTELGFRVAAITRDVTPNRQILSVIQESEERYRSVVETSPDAILLTDMRGFLTSCNRRTLEMLGYSSLDELNGMNVLNLIVPPERRRALEILKQVYKNGSIRDEEFTVMRKNGDLFITELSANLVRDAQGKPRFMMGIARDITTRRQTDVEMRRLNRALRATSACNQSLVRALDETELLDDICRTVVLEGGYHFAWVGLYRNSHKHPVPVAWYRKQEKRLSLLLNRAELSAPLGPMQQAISTMRPVVIENVLSADLGQDWETTMRDSGMRSLVALPLSYEAEVFGALLIYSRETWAFDDQEMALLGEMSADLSYGIHTLRVRTDRKLAYDLLERSKADLETAYDATLEGWSRALELRERETAGHSKRTVQLTIDLALSLGLSPEACVHARRGALLHDIGKMGIPDSILLKPGLLTEEEWVVMRNHPLYAYQLLENIPYLQPALEIPFCHHERWDGSGYPRGMKGEEIPLPARIFAVVDVWDALTSSRPYRPAWPEQQTLEYIRSQAGISFDPQVVQAFLAIDLGKYRA